MIKEWFKKLISDFKADCGGQTGRETYKCCDLHTLTRQRIEDIEYPMQGTMGGGAVWANYHTGVHKLKQYRYWCQCGTELTDGPSGGCAVNAVCEKCRINYGDLPGYWGH